MTAPQFKFPLQRLLALREKAAQAAATELATARTAEHEARTANDELEARRAEARAALLPHPGRERSVSELSMVAFLVAQLDSSVAWAAEKVSAAERAVLHRQDKLGETVRDRRVLGRLRERQLEGWRMAIDRDERAVMDDIARARHADAQQASITKEG
jgi:flagellar export protein FliJ